MSESVLDYSDHFSDSDLREIVRRVINLEDWSRYKAKHTYRLTCGILLRSLSGNKRIVRRCLVPPAKYPSEYPQEVYHNPFASDDMNKSSKSTIDYIKQSIYSEIVQKNVDSSEESDIYKIDSDMNRINAIVRYFTREEDIPLLNQFYPPKELFLTTIELSRKVLFISPEHLSDYYRHPLFPRHSITNHLVFYDDFLRKVKEFHYKVKRPKEAYDLDMNDDRIKKLSSLPRDACPNCLSRRQIYCGDCGGIPLAIARPFLPDPIELPLDIHMLVHWQENIHKCTGMHARVLCRSDMVSYVIWPRLVTGGDFTPIIESLDSTRDVLLFPCDNAIAIEDFPWFENFDNIIDSSSSIISKRSFESMDRSSESYKRKRLIILEASWNHGKTMANQIMEHRHKVGLSPIPCVMLENIIGEYWRFQKEGHSAVSTIEAIAHTLSALGANEEIVSNLLILFRLQKYRVIQRVSSGGRPPQAVAVEGSGLGSWTELYRHIDISADSESTKT